MTDKAWRYQGNALYAPATRLYPHRFMVIYLTVFGIVAYPSTPLIITITNGNLVAYLLSLMAVDQLIEWHACRHHARSLALRNLLLVRLLKLPAEGRMELACMMRLAQPFQSFSYQRRLFHWLKR